MNGNVQNNLFDLSYLNQIFQGNREMVHNIIELFLDQVPEYIVEMELCVDRKELEALHPLAHKAKSSIAMLGLKCMEDNVLRIEKYSKDKYNMDQLPELVRMVRYDCNAVYEQLRQVLAA